MIGKKEAERCEIDKEKGGLIRNYVSDGKEVGEHVI